MAWRLGVLTGIGGSMARDVLLTAIPMVLHSDLYALAALAGAVVVVIADRFQLPAMAATTTGAALCFLAIRFGWRLPSARPPGHSATVTDRDAERPDIGVRGS